MGVTCIVAYCLLASGAFVSGTNFYLSFVHPAIHRLRRQEYRFVSGIPLIGSLLLVIAAILLPSGNVFFPAAIILAVLDTGGIHWFLGVMLVQRMRETKDHHAENSDK